MPTNKQRREAARRHLERQLTKRREAEARRKRVTAIVSGILAVALIAVVVIVIVATTGDDKKTPSANGVTCAYTPDATGAAAKAVSPPSATDVPNKGTVEVALVTTAGNATLTLDRAAAPCTVNSFVSLVTQKYYDATPCHRLTSGQLNVLQCGDPTGQGTGGPGYTIPDEYTGAEKYTSGTIAMANTGSANTGGSQFFINYADSTLQPQYTVFGTVTSGLDVFQKIAAAGSNNANGTGDGAPNTPISITSATVVESTGSTAASSSAGSSSAATTATTKAS